MLASALDIEATSQQTRFHADLEPDSKHVELLGIDLSISDVELLSDAQLHLRHGTCYGLVGRNGVGKSTLLRAIAERRLVGFPRCMSVRFVQQDAVGDDRTALQTLLDTDQERVAVTSEAQLLEAALSATGTADSDPFGAPLLSKEGDPVASTPLTVGAPLLSKEGGPVAASTPLTVGALLSMEGDPAAACNPLTVIDVVHRIQGERASSYARAEALVSDKRSGRRGQSARRVAVAAEKRATEAVQDSARPTPEEATALAHHMLTELYQRLAEMDVEAQEAQAATVLAGLGFSPERQLLPTRTLSGGWRTRLALATALFAKPDLLLLDEPTNHLDLEAVLWLGQYLQESMDKQTVVIVSHDRDFLARVTQETITLKDKKLLYFPGGFGAMEEARQEAQAHHAKQEDRLQRKQAQLQDSIDNALRAARSAGDDKRLGQVASRRKKLEERLGVEHNAAGHRFKLNRDLAGYHTTRRPQLQVETYERDIVFTLPSVDDLRYQGPLLQVRQASFAYPGTAPDSEELADVTLNLDLKSRVGLVGANGAGKSTLMGLIEGSLRPVRGSVQRYGRLRVGLFSQHLDLNPDLSPMEALMERARASSSESVQQQQQGLRDQEAYDYLGGYGVCGRLARTPCGRLSGGQRCCASLALLMWGRPHLLLLDEPTNHLDHESIEALTRALRGFDGGVVVASHDVRFLGEVCGGELHVVRGGRVRRQEGGIESYVQTLLQRQASRCERKQPADGI